MEKTPSQATANIIRVVLYGPESTGKTTLGKQLAAHFEAPFVSEYMRDYLQEKWDSRKKVCEVKDLIPIAIGQMEAENRAIAMSRNMIICDTNLLELKVYSQYYFDGFCPSEISETIKKSDYSLYLLTDIDVPWQADDLRDRPNDRSTLFRIFETALQAQDVPYIIINGSRQQRFATAVAAIESLPNKTPC